MNNQWISVEDRLPEEDSVVLVFDGLYVWIAYRNHVLGTWNVEGDSVRAVTHWMPLPEPPEVQS